jgi:hypothetical protein
MFLALLDTGSVRSFISYDQFIQLQQRDPGLRAVDTKVERKSTSLHHLDIVGEVNLLMKVQELSWKFPFLVAKNLACGLILGIDFIEKTGLVLDILKQEYYFHSDAGVRYNSSLPDSSGFDTRQIHNIDNIG